MMVLSLIIQLKSVLKVALKAALLIKISMFVFCNVQEIFLNMLIPQPINVSKNVHKSPLFTLKIMEDYVLSLARIIGSGSTQLDPVYKILAQFHFSLIVIQVTAPTNAK